MSVPDLTPKTNARATMTAINVVVIILVNQNLGKKKASTWPAYYMTTSTIDASTQQQRRHQSQLQPDR